MMSLHEKVLATLEKYDGRFDDSFDELLGMGGEAKTFDLERFRKVTLKRCVKKSVVMIVFGQRFRNIAKIQAVRPC